MIQDTSTEAYKDIKANGVSDKQVDKYLHNLSVLVDATDSEMAKFMDIPPSQVSARRNDILKNRPKHIEFSKKRKCEVSGRTANAWKVVRDEEQRRLINE
jgi:hypothetical protein